MAGMGSLVVELSANIARFESAMSRANYVAQQNTRQITGSINSMKGSFDAIPGSIMRIVAAAGGLYGLATVFKSAMTAADEFQMTAIGIAAGLTNIAKPGQGDWGDIFKRNMAYAKEMSKELERVAAVSPAEPAEMMMAYNQLVQQGYAARLDEADALGVIVTRIKLATAGQASNKQINQEIRAVIQGQAKEESMVAMELKNRLGPAWADIVRKQAESGNLLKWWASLYPGITAASAAFQNTIEAQRTTLIGNLKYLSREGMGGAYDYIVMKAQELNTYLQDNGTILIQQLGAAWRNLKPSIEAAVAGLVSFAKFMGDAAMKMTEVIARTTEWLKENKSLVVSLLELYAANKVLNMITGMTAALVGLIMNIGKTTVALSTLKGLVNGPWNPIIITVTVVGLAAALTGLRKLIQAKLEAAGVMYPNEAERAVTSGPRDQVISAAGTKSGPKERANVWAEYEKNRQKAQEAVKNLKPPEVTMPKFGGKEGGGGGGKGGAEASADRMLAIIDELNKEIAKLSQGSMAEIDAWAQKTIDDIEKVGRKGAETQEALALVAKATALKKQKIEEEFQVFVGKESGNAYVEIEAQAKAWLMKYKGIKGSEEEINRIVARKNWEEEVKQYSDRLGLAKGFLSEVQGLAPLFSEQLALKQKMLPLEQEIARFELERKLANMQISEAQKDELRGLQALTAQAKKYALEREQWATQGVGGGMKTWATGKQKEGETGVADQTVGVMKSLETGIASTISKGLVGALKGEKTDLAQVGWGIADAFITKTIEMAVSQLFLTLAQGFLQSALITVPVQITTATTVAGIETTAATTSGVILTTAGTTLAGSMITGATTAAGILSGAGGGGGSGIGSILGVIGSIFGFHDGGIITAHGGWPLAQDERIIKVQTGERVLSRRQNRNYEAGMGGGGMYYSPVIHAVDAKGVNKILAKHGRTMMRLVNNETRRSGR